MSFFSNQHFFKIKITKLRQRTHLWVVDGTHKRHETEVSNLQMALLDVHNYFHGQS